MKWKRKHTLAKRAGNSHFDRKYDLRKFHAAGLARINLRVEQKLSQTDQLSIFSIEEIPRRRVGAHKFKSRAETVADGPIIDFFDKLGN